MDLSEEQNMSDAYTTELKRQHDIFAHEAFVYLLDYFKIQFIGERYFEFFTEASGRAIVTIGYTFRRRTTIFLQNKQFDVSDKFEFERFCHFFVAAKDKLYYYRFLKRISYIFELTMYCFKNGYNYISRAIEIVSDYDSVTSSIRQCCFFNNYGGWPLLNETASCLAEAWEILHTVILREAPQDSQLKTFVEAVECAEKAVGSSSSSDREGMLNWLKKEIVSNIGDIGSVDRRIIKTFFCMLCHPASKVFAINAEFLYNPFDVIKFPLLDFKSERELIVTLLRSQLNIVLGEINYLGFLRAVDLAGYLATIRHLTDLISVQLEMEQTNYISAAESNNSESLNQCFILQTNKYINARKIMNQQNLLQEQSFDYAREQSNNNHVFVSNTRGTLNLNIDQNNFFALNDGNYVVYTPGCTFDHNTTIVYVTE